jgi:hypothetical protein
VGTLPFVAGTFVNWMTLPFVEEASSIASCTYLYKLQKQTFKNRRSQKQTSLPSMDTNKTGLVAVTQFDSNDAHEA